MVNQRVALEGKPASGRSILFISQILQKLVEEEEDFFGGTPKSDSIRPEGFMSWVKLGAQRLVMRPRKNSSAKDVEVSPYVAIV